MPRAIGIGSHLILVFLSAEFNRDRNDSFLWNFCWSKVARDEEKLREGIDMRAWHNVGGGHRVRAGARMSWREQEDAMSYLIHYLHGAMGELSLLLGPIWRAIAVVRYDGEGVARKMHSNFVNQ
jgi:hypothetical protein